MPWKVFEQQTQTDPDVPTVGLQADGTLTWNRAAHELLGQPAAVEYLFDPEAGLAGLRAVERGGPGAHRIYRGKRSASPFAGAAAFCRHWGIALGTPRRFPARLDGDILTFRPVLTSDTREPGHDAGGS